MSGREGRSPGSSVTAGVLIVEQDSEMRSLAVATLSGLGFQVCQAATAAEAVHLQDREAPDILVTSVALPDGNGLGLAGQLRSRSAGLKVIYTWHDSDVIQIRGTLDVNSSHLKKPFTAGELAGKVTDLIGRPERR